MSNTNIIDVVESYKISVAWIQFGIPAIAAIISTLFPVILGTLKSNKVSIMDAIELLNKKFDRHISQDLFKSLAEEELRNFLVKSKNPKVNNFALVFVEEFMRAMETLIRTKFSKDCLPLYEQTYQNSFQKMIELSEEYVGKAFSSKLMEKLKDGILDNFSDDVSVLINSEDDYNGIIADFNRVSSYFLKTVFKTIYRLEQKEEESL